MSRGEVTEMLRADDVASVIIARSGPWIDAMSLQKLLYDVQAWHLAITDEPLFEERFKAYRDGPVVPQVWHARKGVETRRATDQDIDGISLDDETSDLIDLVLTTYGSMSGDELSALTHVEHPWREARGDLPPEAHGSTEDGMVFGACRYLAGEDPLAKVYWVTRDRGFIEASASGALSHHSRVMPPALFVGLLKEARIRYSMRRMSK